MSVSADTESDKISSDPSIKGKSAFGTVDDIFTQLSISEIQKLNREYKQDVEKAKQDLHRLVGDKYRDLIKIAEDIGDMYEITRGIDQKLSNLSYSQTKFVNFTSSNSSAKFNSYIWLKEANKSRKDEKVTILNSLINNSLFKFDLRISSDSITPLKNTSNFIYYSKVYYTIECIFKDSLMENNVINSEFQRLKLKFTRYLESEISQYNLFNNLLYSNYNDMFKLNQRLSLNDLLHSQWYNDDDLDYSDDEDYEEDGEEETIEEIEESYHETYNKNLVPIINYLIAYIILNHNNPEMNTLSKVLDKFIELRYNYLDDLLSQFLSKNTPTSINFLKVFKYIESTCDYILKYFQTSNNVLLRNLKQFTCNWKGSDLVGFHDWLEVDLVHFNHEIYLIDLPKSVITETSESLSRFRKLLSNFIHSLINNKSISDAEALPNSLIIFYNCIIGLKRIHSSNISNDLNSNLTHFIITKGNKDIITNLLYDIINQIKDVYSNHFNKLLSSTNSNILSSIKSNLIDKKFGKGSDVSLFSSTLIDIIDRDLDKYVDIITKTSFLSLNDNICEQIDRWFDDFIQFNELIDLNKAINSNKLDSFNCLNHLSKILLKRGEDDRLIKWGNFSRDLLIEEFSNLSKSLNDQLWNNLFKFIQEIENLMNNNENETLESLYYILSVLITIKDKTLLFNQHDFIKEFDKMSKLINELSKKIYFRIIRLVPSSSFLKMFNDFIEGLIKDSKPLLDDIPSRPSLKLSALVYHLSTNYLLSDYESPNCNYGKLFSNRNVNKLFIELKNDWFLNDLIEERILNKLESIKIEESIKDQKELKEDQNGEVLYRKEAFTKDTEEAKETEEFSDGDSTQKTRESSEDTKDDDIKAFTLAASDSDYSTRIDANPHTLSKDKTQVIFANIIYLLQFTSSTPIDDINNQNVQEIIKKLNKYNSDLPLDDVTGKIIIKGVSEFYKANKGIYLPLSIA